MSTTTESAPLHRSFHTFEKNKPAPCLRIETEDRDFIVPYADLIKGTLNQSATHLSLWFNALDVVARGENLKGVLRELQGFNVEFLRVGHQNVDDKIVISSLIVTEAPMEERGTATP
jgi:hypothetical protein